MDDLPTLGLLTGISYVSGLDYYKHINERFARIAKDTPRLAGAVMVPNPPMVMVSVNCDRYATSLVAEDWPAVAEYLLTAVGRLVAAGADVLCIASNTGHIAAEHIAARHPALQLLHIADTTARYAESRGWRKVGLLGTAITMRQPFLKERLARHRLDVLVPEGLEDQETLFGIIMHELSAGRLPAAAREFVCSLVSEMAARGADAVILGCTELELLFDGETDMDLQGPHASDRAPSVSGRAAVPAPALPLLPSGRVHMEAAACLAAGIRGVSEYMPSR